MGYNETIKERLDTVFKDATVWERAEQEADYTKVKRVSGKKVELVDITTAENFDEIKNAFNYHWHFERLKNGLNREPTIYDYYCLYTNLLKDLNRWFGESIFSIFVEKSVDWTFYDVMDAHEKEELKLEFVFNEYTAKLETSVDMTINAFPKNLTEKEKNILNHLAQNFFIKRNLTPNGLLPLFGKNGTKRLLEEFYKYAPEYKDFQAFNFIKASIETNLPDATLQNYCREIRKDVVKI